MPGPATSSLTWKVLVASRHTHTMNGQIDRFVEAGETQAAQMTRRKWQSSSPASSQPPPHLAPGPQGTKGGGRSLVGQATNLLRSEKGRQHPQPSPAAVYGHRMLCAPMCRGATGGGGGVGGAPMAMCVYARERRGNRVCVPVCLFAPGRTILTVTVALQLSGDLSQVVNFCRFWRYAGGPNIHNHVH